MFDFLVIYMVSFSLEKIANEMLQMKCKLMLPTK